MQESLGGDASSASAKRALAKVQRMLQVKRTALALRDFQEALEECLKTEASSSMKILGYRLASRCPSCSTFSTWQLVLDACVTELASSQNASVLLYAIPLLQQLPLPLVLSFFVTAEKEPMTKLRAVLTHEQLDVRCAAIATFSRVTLSVAVSLLTADGLYAFPFESHEARVCAQQDVWTIVTDTWKLIFQALFTLDSASPSTDAAAAATVAGAAFTAMRILFARSAAVNAFSFVKEAPRAQSAINDLVATMFKDAAPRVLAIQATAKRLPLKYQVDALTWVAMLLYMMMDKTGAQCPGVSLPYLAIDAEPGLHDDDDDDDRKDGTGDGDSHGLGGATHRVRMDQLAADVLESWICPLFGRKASLAQSTALCRAAFLLLSHPLLAFVRLKRATSLVHELLAQCFYHKRSDYKLEMSQMLVQTFAWVAPSSCLDLFVRVVEALSLMDRETDRQGLLQLLMDTICARVVRGREFRLLEALCALDFFRQSAGTSRLAPRATSAPVFRCLVQALALEDVGDSDALETAACVQVAQLIVLKAFEGVLLTKSLADSHQTSQSSLVCYIALLVRHYQRALHTPALLFRESLAFFQTDVQRMWRQVASPDARVQLVWVGLQLGATHPVVPPETLYEQLCTVLHESFGAAGHDRDVLADSLSSSANAAFDDGRLGSSASASRAARSPSSVLCSESGETLVALADCLHVLAALQPQLAASIQRESEQLKQVVAANTSAASLEHHMLQELFAPPAPDFVAGSRGVKSLYTHERFQPAHLFAPQKHRGSAASTSWPLASPQARVTSETDHDGDDNGVVVTGSSDPLALRVSFRQPIPGHEDVVSLCVSCVNATNLTLSDFEIHIRPLGALKCVDSSNDLKLRLLQGGESASGGLTSFGVFKGEKRFQLQRFAHAAFTFQVVFFEVDAADASGDGSGDAPQVVPIRLASSERYVLPFPALCRSLKPQFATAAFFQRAWQRAEATCLFPVESTPSSNADAASKALSLCQRLVKHRNSRISVISDLLVDTPIHIHIAFLTETRWEELVAASVTLTSALSATSAAPTWSGVLEVRSTSANVHEFTEAPPEALAAFCGREQLQLARGANKELAAPDSQRTTSRQLDSVSRADSSTASARASSAKWSASPFDGADVFGGEQHAQETALNVFKRFLTSEDTNIEHIRSTLGRDVKGIAFVKFVDRFAVHLAFSNGRGGQSLARNTVMGYYRGMKNWLLDDNPQNRQAIKKQLLKMGRTLERYCLKRTQGGIINKATTCTKEDMQIFADGTYYTATASKDYQDAALLTIT